MVSKTTRIHFALSFTTTLLSISDMRKAMTRDKDKKSMIPLKHPVRSEDEF